MKVKGLQLAAIIALLGLFLFVPARAAEPEKKITADGLFEYLIAEDHVEINRTRRQVSELTIPDEIDGLPVTALREGAIKDCYMLRKLKIYGNLTHIDEMTFFYSSDLEAVNVTADNKVFTDIDGVLYDKGLTKLIFYPAARPGDSYALPDSVTEIGFRAMYGSKLTTVNLPPNLKKIGKEGFASCERLTELTLPDSVAEIGPNAFAFDRMLREMRLPEGLAKIDSYTFYECSALKYVYIPPTVTVIGYGAFSGSGIRFIRIPHGVTTIGDRAFLGCENLEHIFVPHSVTWLGREAFYSCSSLTDAVIGDSLSIIFEDTFSKCSALRTVTLGAGMKIIDSYAFFRCSSLQNVYMPKGLTYVGKGAFFGCGNLGCVYYDGSEADFALLNILEENETLLSANYYYNYYIYDFTPLRVPELKLSVNGAAVVTDIPPVTADGVTMAPVRVLEPLGVSLYWSEPRRELTIGANGNTVVIATDNEEFLVNGEWRHAPVTARSVAGRVIIPVRAVATALGYNVSWDPETNTVDISAGY